MKKTINILKTISPYTIFISIFLYMTMIIILPTFHKEYSHLKNFISELGVEGAPYAKIFTLILVFCGISFLMFSFKVNALLNKSKGSIISFVALFYFSISLMMGGLFPCDPGCANAVTLSGKIHIYSGGPLLILMPAGFITFSFQVKNDEYLNNLSVFSFVSGILLFLFYIMSMTLFPYIDLIGLGQRLTVIPLLLWPLIVSIKVIKSRL